MGDGFFITIAIQMREQICRRERKMYGH
jgi:hypothetical protein